MDKYIVAKIGIHGAKATVLESNDITMGLTGAVVQLIYDDDLWQGMRKKVTFRGTKKVDVLTDENVVELPWEVTTEKNAIVSVGITGVDAVEKTIIPTVWATIGAVKDSPYGDHPAPGKPSPPEWAQVVAMIGDLNQLDTVDKRNLVAAVNEAMRKSGDGAGGYYTPVVTQPTANTMKISFTPSVATMPAVEPVTITLPGSDSGQNVLYIGPDEPIGENRPLYWLDTGMDDAPVHPEEPEEPDVPVEPEKTLTGITVDYTGGNVPVGTAVTALTGITVTASYSDGTSETVTGYTLSGTISEGSNTVTVTYQGKTATFTVTGVAQSGGELPDLSTFVLSKPWLTADLALAADKAGVAVVSAGTAADDIPLTEYFTGDYDTLYAVNFRPNATDEYGWYSKWLVSHREIQYNQPTFIKIAEVSAPMRYGVDGNRLRWMPLRRADVLSALASTEYTSDDVRRFEQNALPQPKNYNMGIVWMASEPTEIQQRAIIEFFENGGVL